MKRYRRLVSLICTFVMVLSFVPLQAAAEGTAPVLKAGAVFRKSATDAEVRFVSDSGGMYYYKVTESADAPDTADLDTWTGIGAVTKDKITVLTPAELTSGPKYVHIVVVDGEKNKSDVLSVEMPHNLYYFDDFETYAIDDYPDHFTSIYGGLNLSEQKVISTEQSGGAIGKVFRLRGTNSVASHQIVNLSSAVTGTVVYEADIKPISNAMGGIKLSDVVRVGVEDGYFRSGGGDNFTGDTGPSHDYDKWYNLRLELDYTNRKFHYYVDDNKVNPEALDAHPSEVLNSFGIFYGNRDGTNECYFDNLKFYAVSDTTAPVLKAGAVYRTSSEDAEVRFVSDEAGTYYYQVTDTDEANFPDPKNLGGWTNGGAILANEIKEIALSGMASGPRCVHIVVEDAAKNVSDVLTVSMPYDLYYSEDFETYAVGGKPDHLYIKYGGAGEEEQKIIADTRDGETDKVFRLKGKEGLISEYRVDLPAGTGGTIAYEADIKPVSEEPGGIQLRGNSGGAVIRAALIGGKFYSWTGQGGPEEFKRSDTGYSAGTWYNLRVEWDYTNKTFDYYVDGVKVGSDNLPNTAYGWQSFELTSGNEGIGNEIYFDNVRLYYTATDAPILKDATTNNDGTKVILTFDKDMAAPALSGAVFAVVVDDTLNPVQSTDRDPDNAKKIVLTLTNPIAAGAVVILDYPPGTAIKSSDDGVLLGFSGRPVTNIVDLSHTITVSCSAGGSIEPTVGSLDDQGRIAVAPGGDITFNIKPNAGYKIQDVSVDNTSVGAMATYTFTNVGSAHTIHADFVAESGTGTVWDGVNVEDFNLLDPGSPNSETNPYIIDTAAKLAKLAQKVNGGNEYVGEHFKLTKDLDLNKKEWTPIGQQKSDGYRFKGIFNGGDHSVTNLKISSGTAFSGLFAYLGEGSHVKSLVLSGASIAGGAHTGALAGYCRGNLSDCSASGTVSGKFATGGMVGKTYGSLLERCHSSVDVSGQGGHTGGLAGYVFGVFYQGDTTICLSECSATGNVKGEDEVGGLAGYIQAATCLNSYSDGNVSGTSKYIGGLFGVVDGANSAKALVKDCYTLSPVSASVEGVGGLTGANWYGTIENCYAAGTVSAGAATEVGGLVGERYAGSVISRSYYDKDISGQTDADKGTPKSTAEMKKRSTFTGWNFPNPWTMNATDNDGYPALAWQGFADVVPKLTSVTPPVAMTLANEYASADDVLAGNELPTTVTITADNNATNLPCVWSFNGEYNAAAGKANVFTWTATTAGYDVNGQVVSGNVTITNKAAPPPPAGAGGSSPAPYIAPVSSEVDKIDARADISGQTATVSVDESKLEQLLEDEDAGDTISIAVTPDRNINTVSMGAEEIKKIAEAASDPNRSIKNLEVKLDTGTVQLDADALNAIAASGSKDPIEFHVENIPQNALTAEQRSALKEGSEQDVIVRVTISQGGKTIGTFGGGKVTIVIPYELKEGQSPEGVRVWYVAPDGSLIAVEATYDTELKAAVIVTDHLSEFLVGYDEALAWKNPFTDVSAGDWFYGDVAFVFSNNLMKGTKESLFSPNAATSRGMIVTVLHRLEGSPAAAGGSAFPDVAEGSWYADAVKWALEKGIVKGYANGRFGPEDPVTREQIVAIMYRYAEHKGYDTSPGEDNLSKYSDAAEVSSWARDAMLWARNKGIVSGTSDTTLEPAAKALRAEIAAILRRFIEANE